MGKSFSAHSRGSSRASTLVWHTSHPSILLPYLPLLLLIEYIQKENLFNHLTGASSQSSIIRFDNDAAAIDADKTMSDLGGE